MSLLIGIKEETQIRYISVESYEKVFDIVVAKLRNFYTTSQKVKALIDLGNLVWLGASPYNKYKGGFDHVNCDSKIRDRKLSPGKHGSQRVNNEVDFVKKIKDDLYGMFHCCFLFEDNRWYILVGNHKERIEAIDRSILKKDQLMYALKVYEYVPDDSYRKLSEKNVYSWREVQQAADESQKTYFIFRRDKFITTISPSPKLTP